MSEEVRLDMDKVKENERSNGERICVNGEQEGDEEQVTNLTQYKRAVTCS